MIKTTVFRALLTGAFLTFPAIAGAQAVDSKAADYSRLLSQIADKKIDLMQSEVFAARQASEIEFLRSEISGVKGTTAGVDDVLSKMVAQIEDAVVADLPFLREERLNRVAKLKNDLANDEISVGAKYRYALAALKAEVEYGMSVEDYDGERPLNDGESVNMRIALSDLDDEGNPLVGAKEGPEMGTYLRYGRVALVYMDDRMVSARRYDVPTATWVDVSGGELLDVRKAVRVARGEVAPAVVMALTHTVQ